MTRSPHGPIYCSLLVAALIPAVASAAPQPDPRSLTVPFIDELPRLDGRLDEPVWTRAAVARDFVQKEPRAGQPAAEPTEVLVYYTATHLVVGARLRDREPARIVATEYVRDADLTANDSFEIYLDTFHDRRNAFYFATNSAGAQRDGLVRNEGDAVNWEWDGVWRVAGATSDEGWIAEFAIPFATLRFRPGGDPWGLNFGRLVARTREESYWAPISRDWGFNAKWRVSSYGRLDGLTHARPGGRLPLKPYLLAGAERDLEDGVDDDLATKIGLDAKVGLTSTLVADLTVNTDFAQVESDQQQVNLTRFPLFFPEKREFFLENAGLFQVGERYLATTLLFFSRRIGLTDDGDRLPLLGGARVTGKLGRWDLGALDIVSGETRIDADTRVPRTNYAALRVKRDVLARSSIGGMMLSKSPADGGGSNRVLAADTTLAFGDALSVAGFAARSFTQGTGGPSAAFGVDAQWQTDRYGVSGRYVDIGDDFNAEMGFLQRTGIRKIRANGYIARRPSVLNLRQIFVGGDHTYVTDRDGRLQSQQSAVGPAFFLNDGTFGFANVLHLAEGLTEPFELREGVVIPAGLYRFNQALAFLESDRSRRVSGRVIYNGGGFYHGSLQSMTVSGRLRPHNRVTLELEHLRNRIALPVAGGRFTTNLVIARAALAFSPRAFLRGLVQVNDDDRKAGVNLVLRYSYRPGADLFVVYDEERETGGRPSHIKHRQVLVKLTVYVVPM